MIISRVTGNVHRYTFRIKKIADLVRKYIGDGKGWVEPFAGESKFGEFRNDLNPNMNQTHNIDALEFMKLFGDRSLNGVLFDPPYSMEQISRSYKRRRN